MRVEHSVGMTAQVSRKLEWNGDWLEQRPYVRLEYKTGATLRTLYIRNDL